MLGYTTSRILQTVVVLTAISFVGFLLVANLGDPLASLLTPDSTAADREALVRALHLEEPLLRRFFDFFRGLLNGDFGISSRAHEPVAKLIAERLPATVELALASLVITLVFGTTAGVYCGVHPNSWLSRLLMFLSIAGVTLPTFVVGIVLIGLFSVKLAWLPSFGRGDVVNLGYWTTGFLTASGWRALVLPAITLALFQVTFVIRILRTQLMEVGQSEHVRFARARG